MGVGSIITILVENGATDSYGNYNTGDDDDGTNDNVTMRSIEKYGGFYDKKRDMRRTYLGANLNDIL